ncbi:MAG: acyltransferase [Clostridia bacterium]|nr:acyltransferase [Clostridia bacterium]
MEQKVFSLPKRIDSLQALRFSGAMCVTVYHFTGLQGTCPFDFSHAVYLFYIISGFVVMLSTENPEKKRYFLTRRLIRTLPLYWGLTVFTFIAGQFVPDLIGYKPTLEHLIKSMLFIPYRRATAKAGSALRPIVGLGHTLQMEMLFYLLFLVAMRISHKHRGYIAAGLAALVALVGVVFPTDIPVIHFYTANPYVWTSFIAGLGIYGVFRLLQNRNLPMRTGRIPAFSITATAIAVCIPAFLKPLSVWYSIPMFALVLCAGLVWSGCGFRTPNPLVKLGDVSYSYYLIHYYFVTFAVRMIHIDSFSLRNVLLAVLVCAVAWGVSWVSWYLIENKCASFLLGLLPKQPEKERNPHKRSNRTAETG